MDKQKLYYFIGIKGSGMSSLALILHDQGYEVSGSDIDQYTFTQKPLAAAGIPMYSFDAQNIKPGMIVIRGNAFDDQQVEVAAALKLGSEVEMLTYPELVQTLIGQYTSVGVAGAHGKTSTTGLLAHVLSGIAPTSYLIGDGTGKGVPDARFFAFEADEYRRHFKDYTPDYAIMTNIDFDHPDYYRDIDDVFDAFNDFSHNVKKAIFAWGDDVKLRELETDVPVYYYGLNDKDDFIAKNIKRSTKGSSFDAYYHDELLGNFQVPLFGIHGILNSLSVIAVAYVEEIDLDLLQQELLSFKGVKRRFTEKTVGDVTIIDDYAHHPSEIKATLDAARQKFPGRELVAVFQPHTFSRTIAYLDEFAESLDLADRVYLTDIFASARETQGNISSADLGAKMTKFGGIISPDDVAPLMQHDQNPVVVFMGAGDVQQTEFAYEKILSNLTSNLQ
ncbi:UDP-N-acetylmuramate--L-alanine ligase [Weissella koreensis]|uniref:UDP-N-acetylmuramate--L-alanine ligase n=1 Tax=Weissella koreensis TaxID=165096 RepID=UPI0002175A83|nr:UDP-N-acetylmuramate--L-alanine ligase [Weissella koreensis]AEJ24170.1 UDP-N-acetylmuramate--L-alanine ligase [Weissella koreensis KACC 15510]EJF34772.1 UDP-N-acetylmuramate--L-alanine ligase [Weissella koreensis KCTC 3621]MCZ9311493.1 UDP-N-acetylmuramate--L-alanine ligase [Weissella koreensis]